MAKKMIYKSVLTVEILSDTPLEDMDLAGVAYAITDGDCSGRVNWQSRNNVLVGKEAANAMIHQGSSPEFFQMDRNGNELED